LQIFGAEFSLDGKTMRAQITTTTDSEGREWLHVERLRYYLYEDPRSHLWCVINRNADFAVTKNYKTKRGAIGAFRRNWNVYQGRLPYYR
jgi:hypothetical protein